MISVEKNYKNPPPKLNAKGCNQKKQDLLKEGSEHKCSDHYYGHETVRKALTELYHKKCAYCESNPEATSSLRVDHFRPKKKIKKDEGHPGYYWLCYEWSNLVPACEQCNGNKSNFFPIHPSGKRVVEPECDENGALNKEKCYPNSDTFLAEKPLLLHPEVDKPEEHFVFSPNGVVVGLTERGKETINICQLNREGLIRARKKIFDDFRIQIEFLLLGLIEFKGAKRAIESFFIRLLRELYELREPEKTYSRFGWFMFEEFESFFVERLGPKQQTTVKKAYEFFKEKYGCSKRG